MALGSAVAVHAGSAIAGADKLPRRWDGETDVVVVGGGGAGLAAAIEAGKAGAKVILVEKTAGVGGDTFRNGGVMAGQGTRLTKAKGVDVTTEEVWKHFLSIEPAFGTLDPEVARIVAEKGGETIDWLEGLGVKFSDELVADPNYAPKLRIFHQVIGGGRGYAEPLVGAAKAVGVQVLTETRAAKLIIDGERRVVGVTVNAKDKVRHIKVRKAVVLTTGGYGANGAMLELFNPAIRGVGFVCSSESVGDGLVMAMEAGAATIRTSQGPIMYPTVEVEANNIFQWHTMQGGGIAVGEDGSRFVSEDTLYMSGELTKAIIAQIGKQRASQIWMIVNDGPHLKHALEVHPVGLAKADTIEALAQRTGLNPTSLRTTVDRYNRFCAEQKDADFGRKGYLIPLDKGPFYAGRVRPGVVMTTGGIKIDANCRVLTFKSVGDPGEQRRAIPGLYAAGQVAEWSGVGGWTVSSAFTMGRIAGRQAAVQQST